MAQQGAGLGQERQIYADNDVTVTNARVIIRGTTYALRNITSVRARVEPRPAVAILLGLVGVAIGLTCHATSANDDPTYWIWMVIGVIFVAAYFQIKPKHWVIIGTSGTETDAIFYHDPGFTQAIVAAINAAMVA